MAKGQWDSSRSERLDRELNVFRNLGISSYILILAEIIKYCRSCGIPATARGSAVSSLTLNILGISSVDPVKADLLFERFLHERKSSLPDVDLDLPSSRRDEVIGWIFERFGPHRVAMGFLPSRLSGPFRPTGRFESLGFS